MIFLRYRVSPRAERPVRARARRFRPRSRRITCFPAACERIKANGLGDRVLARPARRLFLGVVLIIFADFCRPWIRPPIDQNFLLAELVTCVGATAHTRAVGCPGPIPRAAPLPTCTPPGSDRYIAHPRAYTRMRPLAPARTAPAGSAPSAATPFSRSPSKMALARPVTAVGRACAIAALVVGHRGPTVCVSGARTGRTDLARLLPARVERKGENAISIGLRSGTKNSCDRNRVFPLALYTRRE